MKGLFVALMLAVVVPSLEAIPYEDRFSPWFGEPFEIETSAAVILEIYDSFATKHCPQHQKTCDAFFELDVTTAIFDGWFLEVQGIAAQTGHKDFNLDAIFMTGGAKWLNDIVGDPVSLATGITVSQVFKTGLDNIAAFYHGGIEGEFDLVVGKEYSSMEFWDLRLWSVFGVGGADIGYPWLRWNAALNYNWWDINEVVFTINTLWGLGHKSLYPGHFRGYGSIRHQSVDIGVGFVHRFESDVSVSASYSYRVFALNCPKNANFVGVEFSYPFGL